MVNLGWTLISDVAPKALIGLTGGVLLPILTGMKAFQYPSPLHIKQIPTLIRESGASILLATDTFVNQYARSADPGDLSGLQFIVCGAEKVREETHNLIAERFGNVPVLDTGARGSTITFAQRNQGDVLIAWENEAYLATRELGPDKFDIVVPSVSILAEPPVAVVDRVAAKKGNSVVAKAYLEYLYSTEGQEIAAKNYYRPRDPAVAAKYAKQFTNVKLFDIKTFGGWKAAQDKHFADGGVFDSIYAAGLR